GEEDFIEDLIGYVKGQRDIQEIPKEQRFLHRPALEEVFRHSVGKELRRRNRKIRQAVEEHGDSHREIAAHLGRHYTTVSRIINEKWDDKQ
ncbi:MAG: addiction module toxin RelE, partial [bacterium]